jgi:hypothetical protein
MTRGQPAPWVVPDRAPDAAPNGVVPVDAKGFCAGVLPGDLSS